MAIWRTENSMLTADGVDMLNRVKSGDGSGITITKVVIGSERVDESQLYTQSSIGGATKIATLYRQKAIDLGTEISFYITNEGNTETYVINQIGVFAIHPDLGEKLYFISQCDEQGADEIPVYEDTPIRYNYSLLLEHSNSDSITINIDPLGMVSQEEFESLADKVNTIVKEWDEKYNTKLPVVNTFATATLIEE